MATITIHSGASIPPPSSRMHAESPNSYVLFNFATTSTLSFISTPALPLQANGSTTDPNLPSPNPTQTKDSIVNSNSTSIQDRITPGSTFCTKVKFNTSTPRWEQSFTISLPSSFAKDNPVSSSISSSNSNSISDCVLRFVLMDRLIGSPDALIGSGTLPLSKLLSTSASASASASATNKFLPSTFEIGLKPADSRGKNKRNPGALKGADGNDAKLLVSFEVIDFEGLEVQAKIDAGVLEAKRIKREVRKVRIKKAEEAEEQREVKKVEEDEGNDRFGIVEEVLEVDEAPLRLQVENVEENVLVPTSAPVPAPSPIPPSLIKTHVPIRNPTTPPPPTLSHPTLTLRRRLLQRAFSLINTQNLTFVTASQIIDFSKYMGYSVHANNVTSIVEFTPPFDIDNTNTGADVDANIDVRLEEGEFIEFGVKSETYKHLSDVKFVEFMEGYYEVLRLSAIKLEFIGKAFRDVLRFMNDNCTSMFVVGKLKVLGDLVGSDFSTASASKLYKDLAVYGARGGVGLMECRFLAFFALLARGLSDSMLQASLDEMRVKARAKAKAKAEAEGRPETLSPVLAPKSTPKPASPLVDVPSPAAAAVVVLKPHIPLYQHKSPPPPPPAVPWINKPAVPKFKHSHSTHAVVDKVMLKKKYLPSPPPIVQKTGAETHNENKTKQPSENDNTSLSPESLKLRETLMLTVASHPQSTDVANTLTEDEMNMLLAADVEDLADVFLLGFKDDDDGDDDDDAVVDGDVDTSPPPQSVPVDKDDVDGLTDVTNIDTDHDEEVAPQADPANPVSAPLPAPPSSPPAHLPLTPRARSQSQAQSQSRRSKLTAAWTWWDISGSASAGHLKEFGYFMLREFGDEQVKRCFVSSSSSSNANSNANSTPNTDESPSPYWLPSALNLCEVFLNEMPEHLFDARLRNYNVAVDVRLRDLAASSSSSSSAAAAAASPSSSDITPNATPNREELLDAVLRVLTCHRSGTINSQELFCFGRCISSALAMHGNRYRYRNMPSPSTSTLTSAGVNSVKSPSGTGTFEWEDTQVLLTTLSSCTSYEMKALQFFAFFAALTYELPDADFHAAIERFMALASETFDDLKKEAGAMVGGKSPVREVYGAHADADADANGSGINAAVSPVRAKAVCEERRRSLAELNEDTIAAKEGSPRRTVSRKKRVSEFADEDVLLNESNGDDGLLTHSPSPSPCPSSKSKSSENNSEDLALNSSMQDEYDHEKQPAPRDFELYDPDNDSDIDHLPIFTRTASASGDFTPSPGKSAGGNVGAKASPVRSSVLALSAAGILVGSANRMVFKPVPFDAHNDGGDDGDYEDNLNPPKIVNNYKENKPALHPYPTTTTANSNTNSKSNLNTSVPVPVPVPVPTSTSASKSVKRSSSRLSIASIASSLSSIFDDIDIIVPSEPAVRRSSSPPPYSSRVLLPEPDPVQPYPSASASSEEVAIDDPIPVKMKGKNAREKERVKPAPELEMVNGKPRIVGSKAADSAHFYFEGDDDGDGDEGEEVDEEVEEEMNVEH